MGFDKQAFMKASFSPRTAEVKLSGLAEWFDGDAVFTLRGLTSSEVAKSHEAVTRNKQLDVYAKAISSTDEQIAEIKRVLGMGDNTPDDIAKRLDQLVVGAVDPVVDYPLAVKLAKVSPGNFYLLTNKIQELTALGMDVEKPAPSGRKPKSKTCSG